MLGFQDQSVQYTGIQDKAYHLVASSPIVAYQFNPLDNVHVFSADASLLLPAHTFDRTYHVLTYPTITRSRTGSNDFPGYFTVVASEPGTTMVTVRVTAGVRAGEGVAAMSAGEQRTFALQQYQVLNMEAVGSADGSLMMPGGDLTGSVVTSDKPVGVFGGHVAATVWNSATPVCCADHLEEQLYPTSAWGKSYAVIRSELRGGFQPDLIRVLAFRPNTTVTVRPAGAPCGPLDAGQFCDLYVSENVEIEGSEPISVGHFLLSSNSMVFGPENEGDPSLALAVPTEQYRKSYTFLTPSQYDVNYVSIAAPASGRVMLDGKDVTTLLAAFGSGRLVGGRVSLTEGQHQVSCSAGCGIEVTGWSFDVSYMLTGGLDLNPLLVP
jgi:hypothetical protein